MVGRSSEKDDGSELEVVKLFAGPLDKTFKGASHSRRTGSFTLPTLGIVSVYGNVLEINEKTYFIFVKYWVLSIE